MNYKGFELYYNEYSSRISAFNKELVISFSMGLTECQRLSYIKLFGNNGDYIILESSMKRYINGYLKYIKEN